MCDRLQDPLTRQRRLTLVDLAGPVAVEPPPDPPWLRAVLFVLLVGALFCTFVGALTVVDAVLAWFGGR